MTEKPPFSSEPHPPGWRDLIYDKVDFRAALKALEGYQHFYTETLRGFVRLQQVRLSEAWAHFEHADQMYGELTPTLEDHRYHFLHQVFKTSAAITAEAWDPSPKAEARTDRAMASFVRIEHAEQRDFDQVRIGQIAYYKLIRGEFRRALESFEFLLNEGRARLEPQQVGFSTGAAAAAHELGLSAEAERHYESAGLGTNIVSQPFKVAAFACRLHVLLRHWGRHEEAASWRQRIEKLECPSESQRCFIDRSDVLLGASKKGERVFLA